ncbi:MAG TPA: hydroxymethylglutaryl-CoA synthase family protein [Myxococcales bacterium]|nr:hydroxymethylglutaryl-CoA synthase family protein [Myxococcales bacterium]
MTGITRYGAYVPPTRLPIEAIGGRAAKPGGPEKAVAWNDEDAITLAVAAGRNCLEGTDPQQVDGLVFASTTHPFHEKQAAALIARALDLRRDVHTADIGGSLRAGTTALGTAWNAVEAGTSRSVLVIASDCRMAAPGSALEANLGDGAAAFLVGSQNVIARIEGSHTVSDEIVDVWRGDNDPFSHSWEDRFVTQEGYAPRIQEAVEALIAKLGRAKNDYARYALYAPDKRSHAGAARALGIAPEQIQDPLFGRLGNTGAAFAPVQLAAALETASAGDRILVASYGDGAEALSFEVTEAAQELDPPRGVSWHLDRRRTVASYNQYLASRGLGPQEWPSQNGPGLSATIHFRERDDDIAFRGQICRKCDSIQFPAQPVCETCFARDEFDPTRLADRCGRVVTYTFDYFFPTPDPPTVVSVVDIDGARVHIQVADCPPEDVEIGMELEFVFRRIHEAGGRPNYFWKGVPRA